MTLTAAEPVLNDVLIALHRSLLQYMSNAWPWTDENSAVQQEAITTEAASQAETVAHPHRESMTAQARRCPIRAVRLLAAAQR